MNVSEVMYVDHIDREYQFLLATDSGDTTSDFGVFSVALDTRELLLSVHYYTKDITNFSAFMKELVEYLRAQYYALVAAQLWKEGEL